MGNFFAKTRKEADIKTLQERLDLIEKAADLNGDGIVTKKELKEYAAREIQLKDTELIQTRSEIARLQQELIELKEKRRIRLEKAEASAVKWEQAYKELHSKHDAYVEMVSKQSGEPIDGKAPTNVISNGAIERFVDDLLADPNINIYLLPDKIEKPLYVNTLKIFLSILQKSFNHTNLDIIGHEFKLQMQPTLETRLQDTPNF